jgi:hypothetical protein
MVYFGKVKDGKIIPEPGARLVEGATVRIEPLGAEEAADPANDLVSEAVDEGLRDMSEEHDHYASGAPKRQAAK